VAGSTRVQQPTSRNLKKEETRCEDNRVCVGESLSGRATRSPHRPAHRARGSAVESAFCNALTNNKDGFTSLLAVVAPNLITKPNTVLFNKVTIKGAKQRCRCSSGPAPVAMAVADSVAEGVIPMAEADDLFICVGVFILAAEDDKKIQDYNYKATKESIARAIKRRAKAKDVVAKKGSVDHPSRPTSNPAAPSRPAPPSRSGFLFPASLRGSESHHEDTKATK